jgi:HAD superfamily hydrolase (TIGR01490 family)
MSGISLALFDLDGTLLPMDSDHGFGEFMVREGWVNAEEHRRRNDAFYADYRAGTLDIHAYIRFATEALRRHSAADTAALVQRYLQAVIEPAIRPEALALVRAHREAGDVLAIVSSTHTLITAPIAQRLGIPHLLATELVLDAQGRPSGEILGVPCLREGKVARVEQWLRLQGLAWADVQRSHYYGDSMNDVPLLERVSDPVATNPGAELASLAAQRGWRRLDLFAGASTP